MNNNYKHYSEKTIFQAGKVKKRKKVGLIPVQATAKSRRLVKMRGSRNAIQGRPRKRSSLDIQMCIGEDNDTDGGIVRHKLPVKKKRVQEAGEHSLSSAILNNRRHSKKH